MAKLRGTVYWSDFSFKGERVRQSLKTSDYREANKREKLLERAMWEGKLITQDQAPTVLTLQEAFNAHYREHWVDTKDRKGVAGRFDTLKRFIPGTTNVCAIDAELVGKLVSDMRASSYSRGGDHRATYSRTTINRVLALLGALLGHLVTKGVIPFAPKMPKTKENPRTRYLKEDEEAGMFNALAQSGVVNKVRSLRLFEFLVDTGCRLGEAQSLQWKHIDLDKQVFLVEDPKNGRDVMKPMTQRVLRVLLAEKTEGFTAPFAGISATIYRNAWEWAKTQAGIKDKSLIRHSLRHTTASRLIQGGASLRVVQEFLGHASFQTTLRYAHMETKQLRGVLGLLEGVTDSCQQVVTKRGLQGDQGLGKVLNSQSCEHSLIAQSVEQRTVNPCDDGSFKGISPVESSTSTPKLK